MFLCVRQVNPGSQGRLDRFQLKTSIMREVSSHQDEFCREINKQLAQRWKINLISRNCVTYGWFAGEHTDNQMCCGYAVSKRDVLCKHTVFKRLDLEACRESVNTTINATMQRFCP